MTDAALRKAKRPATVIAGPYGHPFHAAVVGLPIGAWAGAVVFDIVSFLVQDPAAFVTGARWLYAIGVLGALVAAVFGLMDYSRLTRGTRARAIATTHLVLNSLAIVVFAAAWILHLGSDAPTVPGLVLGLVGAAGLGVSGFLGGELVFRHGVRVADEDDQEPGHASSAASSTR